MWERQRREENEGLVLEKGIVLGQSCINNNMGGNGCDEVSVF